MGPSIGLLIVIGVMLMGGGLVCFVRLLLRFLLRLAHPGRLSTRQPAADGLAHPRDDFADRFLAKPNEPANKVRRLAFRRIVPAPVSRESPQQHWPAYGPFQERVGGVIVRAELKHGGDEERARQADGD